MKPTERTKVKRSPKRGLYVKESIYRILDQEYMCHVGIIHRGAPVVIPTMYGREGNSLFLHGASISRLMQ